MVVGLGRAGPALQQQRGGKEKVTAIRKAMQEMLGRDDFSFRCARYQQRREAAHAAQTSLNFAGKSDSFLCCICYPLPCGGDGRWCGDNNSDPSVPRGVVDVVKNRLAEWQLTQHAHEERASVRDAQVAKTRQD
jgi:hypothetical protein